MEAPSLLGDSAVVVDTHFDLAVPFPHCALASVEEAGAHLVVADHADANHGTPMAEQNGCRQRLVCHLSCHRRLPLAVA